MNAELLPKTLQQAIRYFGDAENCHNFMVALRWPDGAIECPHCGSAKVGKLVVSERQTKDRTLKSGKLVKGETLVRRLWNCHACKKQFTAKVGSIFEDSALPLEKWLPAVWLIVNAKNGVSSYELGRALGVTQKTAWFMGHRIRTALHDGGFIKMNGRVEADETYIGGLARNMHKGVRKQKLRGNNNTALSMVQGLLERSERRGHSRVKTHVIRNTGIHSMQKPVREFVEPGSEMLTDAHNAYKRLRDDYQHKFIDHAVTYVDGHVHTNGLENFWCLLKRTVKGTYVCPREFHLFRYLDEQSFRFNERAGNDQDRFMRAMQGVPGRRLTLDCLTSGPEDPSKVEAGN